MTIESRPEKNIEERRAQLNAELELMRGRRDTLKKNMGTGLGQRDAGPDQYQLENYEDAIRAIERELKELEGMS